MSSRAAVRVRSETPEVNFFHSFTASRGKHDRPNFLIPLPSPEYDTRSCGEHVNWNEEKKKKVSYRQC